MKRCVVFAYHNVGCRCLSVLLDQGLEIPLVVTHEDDPGENHWFGSVAELARENGIPVITPEDPNVPEVVERVRALQPDFLFSFYYRKMLKPGLLETPGHGALNMHGSLLPRYRGRAPVNWAVLRGERETGASLHYMELKPDAGDLVDQQAVPILRDDTALDVFHKVTWAAEVVLARSLPLLIQGRAPRIPLDLQQGSYFSGRRPEDGRIDWSASAAEIHNLIRAVAPPYPGTFTTLDGEPLRIFRSRQVCGSVRYPAEVPCFYWENGKCYADCADGRRLQILSFELGGDVRSAEEFRARFASRPQKLGEHP